MDQRLAELVEELTTSGEPRLEPGRMKELKKICKSSEEHISLAYHLLVTRLQEEHAEMRFSAFQVVQELFARSHQFRTLLIANFQEFLELTVGIDHEQPLPPPKEVAQKLRKAAIRAVQDWHEKYGEAYKQLSLGYHFLKQNKKVDFQDVHARTVAERRREEEKQKRLENIYKEKVKRTEKEMEEMSQEIADTLTEMENCFQLLMPDPFNFGVNDIDLELRKPTSANEATPASSLSSRVEVNPSYLGCMDDEQPCCSKDIPPVSQCVTSDRSKEGDEKPEQKELDGDTCSDIQYSGPALDDDDYHTFVRNHGLISHKYTLDLEVSTDIKVQENEDNTAIINSVMDAHKLLRNKFWPSVQSWIQLLTRAGINDDRLRCAIEVKNKLETAMKKYKEMNISFKARKRKVMKASDDDDDDDEDEDEFVEVPEKEGYEPHIPDHLRKEYGLEPKSPPKAPVAKASTGAAPLSSRTQLKGNEDELDPTCAAATLKLIRDKLPKLPSPRASESATSETENLEDSDSKRRKLEERAKAPLMPFGLDLHYWGEDQPGAGKILKFTSEHRFWAPSEVEEEVENKEITEMLKTRYITFAGKFEPVKHKCRAPMPGGTLCERQDRIKCPFHGKIIPRDDSGIPLNAEDRAREEKMKFEKQAAQPEWRDPEFMREVEAATGLDLGSSKSNGKGQKNKGKKQKYPNLTDLKQQANTSRSRLEKKVFNKGAMKRVMKAMNRVDQRKHEKFANQFNYALN
ncbi:UV-stimulated scaffold protein A [Chamaea fasciata]|uniref:UV-stimulated scaffold protein A n=1 Tax=Chamaea fasciata TaxID=190680 RepID=UPI00336AEA99